MNPIIIETSGRSGERLGTSPDKRHPRPGVGKTACYACADSSARAGDYHNFIDKLTHYSASFLSACKR